MFSFEHTYYLLALFLALALVLIYRSVVKWKRQAKKALGDELFISQLISDYSPRKFRLKFILPLVAFSLAIVAVANLRSQIPSEKELKKGIDIVIALDVSNSMLSDDVKPLRLEKAKQYLNLLVNKMAGNNRVGLVLFAGESFLQMPVTSDASAAKLFINNANPQLVTLQGTVISDALETCNNAFNKKEKKYKSIIILSDGEDHDEGAINKAKELAEQGIVIHAIGVGTSKGGTIPGATANEVKKDMNGNVVVSKLNEGFLKEIASSSGGSYQLLDNSEAAAATLSRNLSEMEKKVISAPGSEKKYFSFYPWLLLISLVLIVVELFITEKNKLKI